MIKKRLIICCILLPASYSVCGEQYAPEQRVYHDPFAKPVMRNLLQSRTKKLNSKAESEAWVPKLTSTLRAGKGSMVIVNGQVLKLGQKIEGYRLIEVHERAAVFLKNRQRTRLKLDDSE